MTNPQSFNRYSYVQNDPVNFVDPSGLDQQPLPPAIGPPPAEVIINISFNDLINQSLFGGGRIFGDIHFVAEDPPTGGEVDNFGGGSLTPAPGFDRHLGEPPAFNCLTINKLLENQRVLKAFE